MRVYDLASKRAEHYVLPAGRRVFTRLGTALNFVRARPRGSKPVQVFQAPATPADLTHLPSLYDRKGLPVGGVSTARRAIANWRLLTFEDLGVLVLEDQMLALDTEALRQDQESMRAALDQGILKSGQVQALPPDVKFYASSGTPRNMFEAARPPTRGLRHG